MAELHLLYHELRPEATAYSYVVSPELFERHCALFSQRRDAVATRYAPAVTFDDGNRSDLTFAAPVLARNDLRAHFFIIAGWTAKRAGFLNWSELRELAAAGHTIGAHGLTHKLLTRCSSSELRQELEGARQRLEDGLGQAVTTMSLPGGRQNRAVLEACRAFGYKQVFTSTPAPAEMSLRPATVGRLNLQGTTTAAWLDQVLDAHSGVLRRLARVDRAKSMVKTVLGDSLYGRLWALTNRHEEGQEPAEEVGAP